jgi:hypothetical protein
VVKLERGLPFTPSDDEPEDVDRIETALESISSGLRAVPGATRAGGRPGRPIPQLSKVVSGSPVSTRVFRPLMISIQPPETLAAVFGDPSSRSWTTVSLE